VASVPATAGGIVVLAGHRDEADSGGAAFLRCLERELAMCVSHPLRLTDAAAFKEALFPWFEADACRALAGEARLLSSAPEAGSPVERGGP
jgi:hypothetical protein